ncbi:MAG: hypothetical protein F4Z82_18210 [Caldilineaceae bacterium SB0668_bin_21]|nr:hypothetical protein [Caldilineaceae bacterium SB0668_bin_21]MYC21238.1 hypothetical protein [Caldilineaceae bacterium SB0662_bin_25]
MFRLQENYNTTVLELLSECNSEDEREETLRKLGESMPEICNEIADDILDTVKKDAFSGRQEENRQIIRGFEGRLRDLWGKPLDMLELFIGLALEAGSAFNIENRDDASKANDYVFYALIRLHARACQVSSAILLLLKSGYADDAYARWRSLHEIAVVSSFISQHGQELAERYLLHEVIQQYKLACEHRNYQSRISEEPIPQEEFDILERRRKDLLDRFGNQFKEDYGWAAIELGVARTNFRAIEEQTGLDHLRPYYKMASDNVHANSHGTNHRLGSYLFKEKVLLAGPSSASLADPGHSTAISLSQTTTILLSTRVSVDAIVVMRILANLVDEIGDSFLRAHHQHRNAASKRSDSEA